MRGLKCHILFRFEPVVNPVAAYVYFYFFTIVGVDVRSIQKLLRLILISPEERLAGFAESEALAR